MSSNCPHCGFAGPPRWTNTYIAVVAALVWLAPVAFLSQGWYPFLILPAIALTAWAVMAIRPVCPACGKPWRG